MANFYSRLAGKEAANVVASAREVYGRIGGSRPYRIHTPPRLLNWAETNPIGKRGRMTHTAPQPADQPVFKNAAYTQEYIDIAESLDGDIPGRRAARAISARRSLEQATSKSAA